MNSDSELPVVSLAPSLAVKDLVTPKPGETGLDALARAGTTLSPEANDLPKKRGAPKKLPRQIAAIVALKAEDPSLTTIDIAHKLGMTPAAIRKMLYRARKEFKFNDVADSLNYMAIPQALENLNTGLKGGDKDYTLATLKGVGIFRNHSAVKQEGGGTAAVLTINIQMPDMAPGQVAPVVAIGSVIGSPRRISESSEPVIDAETVPANG